MNDSEFRPGFANLYDAFMNASLALHLMIKSPMEVWAKEEVDMWFASDRARLERCWLTFLFVLVEAWDAKPNSKFKVEIQRRVDCSALNAQLRALRKSKRLDRMREIRDYMCHRDKKALWDTGRTAVATEKLLRPMVELHKAFSAVMANTSETLTPTAVPAPTAVLKSTLK